MPVEIPFEKKDEFISKIDRALECRVVDRAEKKKYIKLKVKTKKVLYTLKLDLQKISKEEADKLKNEFETACKEKKVELKTF